MAKIVNQVNPPKKGRRHDYSWKVYFKHDGASILMFENLPRWKCSNRVEVLKKMFPDWRGSFIVTK